LAKSKVLADQINALHRAREAYIECERDRGLRAALKKKIYKRDDINARDWIYFKNDKKWQDPVKFTTKDGKRLYAVRGGSSKPSMLIMLPLPSLENNFNQLQWKLQQKPNHRNQFHQDAIQLFSETRRNATSKVCSKVSQM
jgi:hypothetical protein